MRDLVTTLLDTTGLLLIAAGKTGGAWEFVGAWALAIGGLVILAGSWLAARGNR
jgi:hypothetical protein